jgi:hypothetical protein
MGEGERTPLNLHALLAAVEAAPPVAAVVVLAGALALAKLVDEYLAQQDGEPETIAKLRWLLTKPLKAFGHRRLPQLHSQEPRGGRIIAAII